MLRKVDQIGNVRIPVRRRRSNHPRCRFLVNRALAGAIARAPHPPTEPITPPVQEQYRASRMGSNPLRFSTSHPWRCTQSPHDQAAISQRGTAPFRLWRTLARVPRFSPTCAPAAVTPNVQNHRPARLFAQVRWIAGLGRIPYAHRHNLAIFKMDRPPQQGIFAFWEIDPFFTTVLGSVARQTNQLRIF